MKLKVIHQHRIGRRTFRRVSELVFIRGEPKAVLEWINMAGDRTPVYIPLDAGHLHKVFGMRDTWFYDGETADPRFEELGAGGTGLAR